MKEEEEAKGVSPAEDWKADWEGHRQWQLTAALAATPAQRLAWLEEMIEVAYRATQATRRDPG